MERESELQRLEKFVEKILTRFTALKKEKAQLEQVLVERDQLIDELQGNISSKVSERNEISERVNKIVDQIEEWELSLEIAEEEAANSSYEDLATDENKDDPQMQEVDSEGDVDDEEKRVQHDLFSMTSSRE